MACANDGSCPGDSVCFGVPYRDENNRQQIAYLCLNESAQRGEICPASYVCREAPAPVDPCQGVSCRAGEVCRDGACVPTTQPSDMGQPPAQDMGVSEPDMGQIVSDMSGVGGPNNPDPGRPDEEEGIIFFPEQTSSQEDGCACSTSARPPATTPLLLLVGLVGLLRRRRA